MAYLWDATLFRYRERNGRFVAESNIRNTVADFIVKGRMQNQTLAQRVLTGEMTVNSFGKAMRENIKAYHAATAAAARGGFDHMSASDRGWLGQAIQMQYRFLDGFIADLQGGMPVDGRMITRAGMYADAAWGTYQHMARRVAAMKGRGREKRVLDVAAEHCQDCVDEARRGWQPIGTLKAIGDTQCLSHCRCRFIHKD